MLVKESPFYNKVKSHKIIELGNLYFFENYFIGEFHEGVNIDFKSFIEAKILIKEFFGDNDFGFIGNRINSYSIVLTDAPLFNNEFKNLKAYATVTYSAFADTIISVENHFFKFNKQNFTSLIEAVTWVENTLNKNTI
jgi:hypothetical protein